MSLRKLEKQVSLVVPTIDEPVVTDHPYRPMLWVLDFGKLTGSSGKLYSDFGCGGYPMSTISGELQGGKNATEA